MEVRVPAQHILKSLRENRMPDRILLPSGKIDQSVKTSLLEVRDPVTIEGYDSEREDEEQEEEVADAMDPANLTINQRWLERLFPTARQVTDLRFRVQCETRFTAVGQTKPIQSLGFWRSILHC